MPQSSARRDVPLSPPSSGGEIDVPLSSARSDVPLSSARSGGGSARLKGSLLQSAEKAAAEARAREEATAFTTDGVNEAELSFEELLERCRQLKASDSRNHAQVRRLQRELHAFASFPFDVNEQQRDKARAVFEQVVQEESRARQEVEKLQGDLHELRSMQALKLKSNGTDLEVHRLRAALNREQAVRGELEKELDSHKRASQTGGAAAARGVQQSGSKEREVLSIT